MAARFCLDPRLLLIPTDLAPSERAKPTRLLSYVGPPSARWPVVPLERSRSSPNCPWGPGKQFSRHVAVREASPPSTWRIPPGFDGVGEESVDRQPCGKSRRALRRTACNLSSHGTSSCRAADEHPRRQSDTPGD